MGNNCVLIVNDSKFESMILKDIFLKLGYNPKISNEYMVIKDLRQSKPFMVIANYIMENTTGDKIIDEIKRRSPETICILSSNSELSKEKFQDSAIDKIIKTPMPIEGMKQMLDKYLQKQDVCPGCSEEIKREFYICPYCGEKLKTRA